MKPVVLDTNILLDIFVFDDERAANLKQAIVNGSIPVIASQKTLLELADVISRPLFKLDSAAQASILAQWQSIAQLHDDSKLVSAPWKCEDRDDQIFLDLAYQLRPSILISKDKQLLKLASRVAKDDVVIKANYDFFKREN